MNPLTDISEAYKRWRHSRGFGVHSPFAYDLVKCVVSPGNYAYYGYNDIDRALLTPGTDVYNHLQHDAYLLLRLLVFLKTKCLIIYPSKQPVMECAAGSAGVKCGVMTKASLGNAGYDTLIFATNISFPNEIMKAMNAGAAALGLQTPEGS